MNRSSRLIFQVIISFLAAYASSAWGDFIPGRLVVVNDPSAFSQGLDSLVELSSDGVLTAVLVPVSDGNTGMSRTEYDPVTGHIYYSISSWPRQIFEIREIDSDGTLIAIHTHEEIGSGNISMAVHHNGDLYIANSGKIFVKRYGSAGIILLQTLPYTGIGDLEIDPVGNLYLSDPFIDDVVYKIFPGSGYMVYAGPDDGIDNPYGLAVGPNGDLYIASYTHDHHGIIRIPPGGDPEVFTTQGIRQGIIDMTFGPDGMLYTANRENHTILRYDKDGIPEVFAAEENGLKACSSMTFITDATPCNTDWDGDLDTDGRDLAIFTVIFNPSCIEMLAATFGH